LTERLAYYAVVNVLRSARTEALGVSGCTGVVLGISDSGSQLEYGILIGEEVYVVDSSDVAPTGEILSREEFYDGTSISVKAQRYTDDV
jgi:Immunity protein 31